MLVIKRDGRKQQFNSNKIINAVQSAFEKVDGEITKQATDKAKEIAKYVETMNKTMTVEEIQDIVENKLMASSRKDVAKEYILYREERNKARELKTQFFQNIAKKINADDVQNQNANVDEKSFGGRKGEADSELMKKYALDYLMSEKAKTNHIENRIYTHDLDSYAVGMHNCLSFPFDDLLKNGFNTRQTDVRPANSIGTATQLIAVISQIQSLQQFGGVSATHIDWTMVPYVRKSFYKHYINGLKFINGCEGSDIDMINCEPENLSIDHNWYTSDEKVYKYALAMTEKEASQGVEGLLHNLNTLQSRSGNQLPFTSINYGTCTLPEGRLYTKALLDMSIKGLGEFGRTSIFPCQIFQIKRGVNDKPGTPNYDLKLLALESTSKRLYPNYCLTNWSNHEKWVELDRQNKEDYINSLSEDEYNALLNQLEAHPELKELLDLDVVDENTENIGN
jgi:ribonucleoside-triphosphate reductase